MLLDGTVSLEWIRYSSAHTEGRDVEERRERCENSSYQGEKFCAESKMKRLEEKRSPCRVFLLLQLPLGIIALLLFA